MESQDIAKKVREFITDGEAIDDLSDDRNLFESGLFDSVRVVNLVLFIESTFDLTLEYEDLTEENLSTVAAITDLIGRKLAD